MHSTIPTYITKSTIGFILFFTIQLFLSFQEYKLIILKVCEKVMYIACLFCEQQTQILYSALICYCLTFFHNPKLFILLSPFWNPYSVVTISIKYSNCLYMEIISISRKCELNPIAKVLSQYGVRGWRLISASYSIEYFTPISHQPHTGFTAFS